MTVDGASVEPDPETGIFEFGDIDCKPRKPAGYGFAVDLGATYDILPNLQASLAVNDLGFISWNRNSTVSGVSTQETEFTGVAVSGDGTESAPRLRLRNDEVHPDGEPKHLEDAPRGGQCRSRIRTLEPPGRIRTPLYGPLLGVQDHAQHHRFGELPPTRWFTLTGSYSVLNNRGSAVGLGLNLCPGWINFFVATDLLLTKRTPQWVPIKQSSANLTLSGNSPRKAQPPYRRLHPRKRPEINFQGRARGGV